MDLPESKPCPRCGQACPAAFKVRRYTLVHRQQLSLAAVDCNYRCSCGAEFSNKALSRAHGPPSRNPLAIDVLLAVLNSTFDVALVVAAPRGLSLKGHP